ncbi:GIY-YIG nuclease family protein [candidate division KSB1 bacterium]|nr:GIY-YIG nuclease family protein [candidate division KSB1 bacterium]
MDEKKKKLKQDYKNRPPEGGVFQIKNLQDGKIYVGSNMNVRAALNSIPFQLKLGVLRHKELQADYNLLGPDMFSFEVLERLEPQDDPNYDYHADLATLEELWLEKLQPFAIRLTRPLKKKGSSE